MAISPENSSQPSAHDSPHGRAPGCDPLAQSDADLLADCDVHRYRASGPGGQKRNKVESAIRLRHRPSGCTALATESRSQHENRARALRRLRMALALSVEAPRRLSDPPPGWLADCLDRRGGVQVGKRHERFYAFVRLILALLEGTEGRVAPAAGYLGVRTSQLVQFMRAHRKLWGRVSDLRRRFSRKPLK